MEERILSELNMDVKMLEDGVEHLKEWIQTQPHLPQVTDENLFKTFIIGSKSVEKAKDRMEKYFSDRNKYKCFFSNRDPAQIEWFRTECVSFLPGLTDKNYKVMLIKLPSEKEAITAFDLEMGLKVKFMMLDQQIRQEPFISGLVVIADYSGVTLKLIYKYTSILVASSIDCFQKGYPMRLKQLTLINAPWFGVAFFHNFIKYLFTEKLRKRLSVHSEDHSVLLEYIPSQLLPKEYGGECPALEHLYEETQKKLIEDREWFMTAGSAASDESKRVKHKKQEKTSK